MKRIVILLIILALTIALMGYILCARAECPLDTPHIVYTSFDGSYLFGYAEVPEGEYYARVTMYLDGNAYARIFCRIDKDGCFRLHVVAHCEYLTAIVTDAAQEPYWVFGQAVEWPI